MQLKLDFSAIKNIKVIKLLSKCLHENLQELTNMNLEKPDCGASYVKSDKRDFCVAGLCAAKTLNEVKSCANYDPSTLFNTGGCDHLASRSGKCLRGKK